VERNLLTLAEIFSIRMAMDGRYLHLATQKTQMCRRNTILRGAPSQVD
jgi:hypothetical protein